MHVEVEALDPFTFTLFLSSKFPFWYKVLAGLYFNGAKIMIIPEVTSWENYS